VIEALERARSAWSEADYYEAHEQLEDLAEAFEDDDRAWRHAVALCQIAAACHKYVNAVGINAVPGKLSHALETLEDAPPDWLGLELAAFRDEARGMLAQIEAGETATIPRLR
jgi:predicted metal-dependent hydrolase